MARLIGDTNSGNYGEKTFVSKACEYLNQIDILSIACQRFSRYSDCLLPRRSFSFTLPLSPCKRRNPQR